ncbi:UDP-N-acetyl-D-mannosaminuronic acid dehydrogenase [Alkalibacillus flavidus]|uniref:UDP-N-acetyl-D-mannosaminuronic acid dehydrogenase n=1 Tax=Alkalibacillus flavidus TaxID=546021 RepID=A0ABV2KXB5_9BACI
MTKICVIGLGYIGLPTSALFANEGYDVVGVDINEHVVEQVNQGSIHIEEPGLDDMVAQAVKSGRLSASTKPVAADYFIIAVPTPVHDDHSANTDFVVKATESIAPVLQKGNTVIVESTIPPRTISDIVAPALKSAGFDAATNDVYLAHCPERVIPGNIVHELKYNHRIVGGFTPEAMEKAAAIYKQSVEGDVRETEAVVAEMSKLMENTFRDVNIALANELSKVADHLNIDASDVIDMANMHPRVNILQPGPGVGGHCIPVDPYFIIEKAKDTTPLMQTARDINDSMPSYVLDKMKAMIGDVQNPTVALLGLTYKGNTSDMRESPALQLIERMQADAPNMTFKCHDPFVAAETDAFPHDLYSLDDALNGADLAVVLADHQSFKDLTGDTFTSQMQSPVVFDTRNIYKQLDGVTVHSLTNLVDTHKQGVQ